MAQDRTGEDAGTQFLGPVSDTLPIHIAVLDTEGRVRSTNRSWQAFAEANDADARPDMRGVNYLTVADAADDPSAARAAAGIRAVLRGDRREFELEYPCHSPEERRWFLLRAVPFTHRGERYASVAHIDITERKQRERALAQQRDELAQLKRVDALVRHVTQALQDVTTRDGIETAVCDRLSESDLYRAVWIGTRSELPTGVPVIVPQTAAGVDESYLETIPGSAPGPATQALETGEPQVVPDVADTDEFPASRRETALEQGYHSLAAVPLTASGTTYGVLVVYAPEPGAISDQEGDILADLGHTIALAIQRVHSQRTLTAETVIALDLRIPDADIGFAAAACELDCELALERRFPTDDGRTIYYVSVHDADPQRVCEHLEGGPFVDSTTLVRDDAASEPPLIEASIDEEIRLPVDVLTDYGGAVTEAKAVAGDITISVELPPEVDVRTVLADLQELVPEITVVGKQHVDRPMKTSSDIRDQVIDELSSKQATTLKAAQARGYYEWPRETTVEDLAETFNVSAPTLHYRLRKAHQEVISSLLEGRRN